MKTTPPAKWSTTSRPAAKRITKIISRIPAQLEFWRAPQRYKAYVGGIGAGKTFAGAAELLGLPAGTAALVVAPTYPMLRDTTVETVLDLANYFGLVKRFNESRLVLDLVDDTRIIFRSAEKPHRLRGPNLGAAWIDEAAYCKPITWKIVVGRVRIAPGKTWITTTPAGRNWVFDRWIKRATEHHKLVHSPTGDNPYLRAEYVADLGEEYDEFWRRQEIAGEFLEETTQQVISEAWWNRCAEMWTALGGLGKVPRSGYPRIACDIAKGSGGDKAGALVRDDAGILELRADKHWDKRRLADEVADLKKKYGVKDHHISYDANGIGDDFDTYLESVDIRGAIKYRGNATWGDGRAVNLRSGAALLELNPRLDPQRPDLRAPVDKQGRRPVQPPFTVPPAIVEAMRDQVTTLRYTLDAGGRRRLETKLEHIARVGHSPDEADMLIQSFAYLF